LVKIIPTNPTCFSLSRPSSGSFVSPYFEVANASMLNIWYCSSMCVINIPCNINVSGILYSTPSLMKHIFIMVWQIPLGLLTCGCVGCACAPLLVCVQYWLCRFRFVVVCACPCFLYAVVCWSRSNNPMTTTLSTTAYRKQGHAQTTTKRNRHNQYRTHTSKGVQAQPTQPHVSNPSGICHTMIKICCIYDGVKYNTPDRLMLHGILITDMPLLYHILSIEALATSK